VVGASVTVKNSTVGTTTDPNGKFSLTVPSSAKSLLISSLGYETREVSITGNTLSITLQRSGAARLDEVVVVGYGTQRKANVTGAISSVKAKDLENVPNGRIEQALRGVFQVSPSCKIQSAWFSVHHSDLGVSQHLIIITHFGLWMA
jgi:hypothetical protein